MKCIMIIVTIKHKYQNELISCKWNILIFINRHKHNIIKTAKFYKNYSDKNVQNIFTQYFFNYQNKRDGIFLCLTVRRFFT